MDSLRENKLYQVLPLLIVWGVWLARNRAIFEDDIFPIEVFATQILVVYDLLLKDQRDNNNRILNPTVVDRSHPWEFFDGTSQGDTFGCGGGFVLHILETHLFSLKMGLGASSNKLCTTLILKIVVYVYN